MARARLDDPVVDEANDCKTENAGAGGEVREADEIADKSAGGGEVWSLESLCELEKRGKLLINPPEELKSGRSRVCVSSRSRRNC